MSSSLRLEQSEIRVPIPSDMKSLKDNGCNSCCCDMITSVEKARHNIYWAIAKQIFGYFLIYDAISLLYNYGLDDQGREHFDAFASLIGKYTNAVPVVLLLGFYTSSQLNRWASAANAMPGVSRPNLMYIMTLKDDTPDFGAHVKRYSRYVLLSWILSIRMVSSPLRQLFPDLISIQRAGLLTEKELNVLQEVIETQKNEKTLFRTVFYWLNCIVKDHCVQGHFLTTSDYGRNLDAIQAQKKGGGGIIKFVSNNFPQVLSKAVTFSIYFFGCLSLVGHQYTEKDSYVAIILKYVPFIHAVPFVLYMVWLNVGKRASDPLGDDDDDINVLAILRDHAETIKYLRLTFLNDYAKLLPLDAQDENKAENDFSEFDKRPMKTENDMVLKKEDS